MSFRKTLKQPSYVILIGLILTIVVAIESLYVVPWSPYFLIYALLAIMIPIYTKSYKFGNFRECFHGTKMKIFVITLVTGLIIAVGLDVATNEFLASVRLINNPYYSLPAALQNLAEIAGIKFGITTTDAILIYALYIIFWAPIGEELFYRGYMYGELKGRYGKIYAALISTFFFGVRHSTHMLFLPTYPLVAGLYWASSAFIFGLIMVYAYDKTDSLYIPMIAHFLINLIQMFM